MDIDTRIRFTGDRRTHTVHDTEYQRPFLLCQLNRSQGIRRLTTLTDCNHHILRLNHGSPYLNSLAYATSTLLRHIFSISCLPDNITHTILQTVRLVIDLLQHKVIKTTLAQLADVQIHGLDIIMTGRMLQVDDIQLLTYPDVSNLTIFQIHHSCSHEDAHW